MKQEELRQMARIVKATEDVSFKEMAEDLLNINCHSFYNWLNGEYNLSRSKSLELYEFLINFLD